MSSLHLFEKVCFQSAYIKRAYPNTSQYEGCHKTKQHLHFSTVHTSAVASSLLTFTDKRQQPNENSWVGTVSRWKQYWDNNLSHNTKEEGSWSWFNVKARVRFQPSQGSGNKVLCSIQLFTTHHQIKGRLKQIFKPNELGQHWVKATRRYKHRYRKLVLL